MSGRQSIDRRGESLHARLDLDPQIDRVGARPAQIAAVNPQTRLLGWFPHVAQFAFPRARVTIGIRTQPSHLAHLGGSFLGNQLRHPFVGRAVVGGLDNEIGGQLAAIGQDHALFFDPRNADPAAQLDRTGDNQLRRPDIDIEATVAHRLHALPGLIRAGYMRDKRGA